MTPQEMRTLYDYNAWANRRAMEAASKLTAEQFVQPMGSSFGSVRDTLAHVYGAEWIWLERFQGRSPASLRTRRNSRTWRACGSAGTNMNRGS